jgi:glucan phosphoethanolaminetransferase (alkaline phosphatase superfamily)
MLGGRPRALLPLMAPTLLSLAIDLALRGRAMLDFQPHGKAIYFSSLLISAAFWVLPLLLASRLFVVARTRGARVGLALFFGLWVLPLATLGYAGQLVYYSVFHAYAGRDTLRLGVLLRGTLRAWFLSWSSPALFLVMVLVGVAITAALFRIVQTAAPSLVGRLPILPVITFLGALFCFWTDNVDSRFLQASTPDTSFVNGVVHALRAALTGRGRVRQGVTLRTPAPLPPLVSTRGGRPGAPEQPSRRCPNILVILAESVRADALCSDGPPWCRARFLDDVVPDRVALGKLTSQTPNTFSASMVLWTGLEPNADFVDAHTAPMLWEIARAVGYRTAYVTSQNSKYEDFGSYVHRAGIDHLVTSTELGGMEHEQLGAPDERATEEMLRFIRGTPPDTPYFAVLHLSNTHHPYRVDPSLQPFGPHDDDPRNVRAYHNHYRNSVLMEERLVAGFLSEVRRGPGWDDTVVVFLSDHGEPFNEHGIVHHNHSVFDEELRIPGWLVAGPHALGEAELRALRSYAGVRTFMQEVNASLVDLLGVYDARASLPLSNLVPSRSLLRPRVPEEDRSVLLATSTGVWEPNDAWFGAMYREMVVMGSARSAWTCFDLRRDPGEHSPLPAAACGPLVDRAARAFGPGIGAP